MVTFILSFGLKISNLSSTSSTIFVNIALRVYKFILEILKLLSTSVRRVK